MSQLRIGRFVADVVVRGLAQDGDALALSILFRPASVSLAKAWRQQILGILNNDDETVIPVTWAGDPDVDGYYRPRAASVSPIQGYTTTGYMTANVTLERVKNGWVNPAIETYVVSNIATNSHSVSTFSYGLLASYLDSSANIDVDTEGLGGTSFLTVEAANEDGSATADIRNYYASGGSGTDGYSLAYVPPADYYGVGSCEVFDIGNNLPVVGRQIPSNTALDWQISNGLIRVVPTGQTNEVSVESWDEAASTWRGKIVQAGRIAAGSFTASSTYEINGNITPVILRNSPEMVSVRVSNGWSQPYYTFTIFRGGTVVLITWEGDSDNHGLGIAPTRAGTNVTGGVRTTTAENGNRFVILNRAGVTTSTTHTAAVPSSATTRSTFAVGWNIGASSSLPYSETGALQQLCAPPQWSQRVTAR